MVKKGFLAAVFFVFVAGFGSASYARTAPQYVPDSVALYRDGKLVAEGGSLQGGYYEIQFGKTVQFDVMAFPDSVTGAFLELDGTVIGGDSFSIKFTPIVGETSEAISWSMTQEDVIANSKLDSKVHAQKIATLSITGLDYPNRKDSDYAKVYIYCEYSFKRPNGADSGIISKTSNTVAIKAVPGGGGGGGGCDASGMGFWLFTLAGAFLIRRVI
jgi:hypothetical protein